jgi:hypothetical protein
MLGSEDKLERCLAGKISGLRCHEYLVLQILVHRYYTWMIAERRSPTSFLDTKAYNNVATTTAANTDNPTSIAEDRDAPLPGTYGWGLDPLVPEPELWL